MRRRGLLLAAALSALLVVLLAGCPDTRVELDGMALEVGGSIASGPTTGNVKVELKLDDGDVGTYLAGGGMVTVGLYSTSGTRSAGGGSTLVPGSQQQFRDPATVIYTANGITVPQGNYEVEIAPSGGSLPGDTKVQLRLPFSVGDRQMTVGTAPVQQIFKELPQPQDFFTSFSPEHDTDMTFEGQMSWTQEWGEEVKLAGTYRKDGFQLEILKWSSGKMPEDDVAWEALAKTGKTYVLTQDDYTPAGSPVVQKVDGGLERGATGLRLKLKREAGQYYAMRLRAVSYTGESTWLYFPYLAMPAPGIKNVTTQNAGESTDKNEGTTWEGQKSTKRWDATFTMNVPKYNFDKYLFEWERMGQKSDGRIRYPDQFDSDEEWEEQKQQSFIGAGTRELDKASASTCNLPAFLEKTPFMARVQVEIAGVGKSAWCYYPNVIKSKDDTTDYSRPTP